MTVTLQQGIVSLGRWVQNVTFCQLFLQFYGNKNRRQFPTQIRAR